MRCFEVLTCNWSSGMIGYQAQEALNLAILTGRRIVFEFNGVTITVRDTDTVEKIVNYYYNNRK